MSSGYTTIVSATETVDIEDTVGSSTIATSDDLCDQIWAVTFGGTAYGYACVQYTLKMSRPFVAEDPTVDMTIYSDPDNSGEFATTYTFRGKFGPVELDSDKKY